MRGIERDFLMSSPFPPYEVKERYFYLCQQFIFLNITDTFTQKILLDQLLNYYETCPKDLETLYLIWIHHQDISRKDFFDLKKISSSKKCVFFSTKLTSPKPSPM